jgi:hypothetical protein
LKGTNYYSGSAAKAYMNESVFEREGIKVDYFDYSGYPEYQQLHLPFDHKVSVLDLLFCEGTNASNFFKVVGNE